MSNLTNNGPVIDNRSLMIDQSIKKLLKEYKFENNSLDHLLLHIIVNEKYKTNTNTDKTFHKYNLGDKLEIEYCPYSQKYLDYCDSQNFCGILFWIDNENDNALFYDYNGDTNTYHVRSYNMDNLNYYGTEKAYEIFMKKK